MGASAAQQKAQADGASSDIKGGSGKELAPSLPPAPDVPNHALRGRAFSNSEFLGTTSDWGEKTQIGGTSQEWRRATNNGTGFNTGEGDLVKVAAQAAAAVHSAGKTAPAGFRRKVSFSSPPKAELSPAQRGNAVGRSPVVWVDELRPETPPPAQHTPVYQSRPKPFNPHEPWMCQICSQRNIPPHEDRCPACTRPRGAEPKRSYATANELTQSVVDAVNGTPGVSIHMMQSSAAAASKGLKPFGSTGKNKKSSGAADGKSSPQRHGLSPDSGYQDSFRDAVPLAAATAPPGKLGQGGKLSQAGRGVAGGKGRGGGWLGRDVAFGGAGPSGRGGGGMQHAASTGGLGLTSDWDALDREMDFKEDAADYQDIPGAAAHRSGSLASLLGGPAGVRAQRQGAAAATAARDRGLQGGGSGRPQPPHMPPEPLLLPNPGADRLPHMSRSSSTPSRGRTPPAPGPPMAGWPDMEVHSLSPGSHSSANAASSSAPPRGGSGGHSASRGAGSSYGPATAGPRPTTPLPAAAPPQTKAVPEVAKASVAAGRRSEAASSSRVPAAASMAASGSSAADVDVEELLKASAGRKGFQGKASTPSRAPASADVDVEALLQAQKARIEGLKTKLNRQLG